MKTKIHVIYILREIVIVVIGVLIAVSINNYKERLSDEQYIRTTLTAIEREILQSQESVEEVMQRHVTIIEHFEQHAESSTLSLVEELGELGGIQAPFVKTISLRFFVSNNAQLIPYEMISQLSDIESNKETLKKKLDRLADYAYKNLDSTDFEAKVEFIYHLSDVVDSEQTLLAQYKDFLKKNKAFLEKKAE